jgi:hypothetical protein
MLGTITGLVMYVLVVWKLSVSASQADLLQDQLIMSRIALGGSIIIPLGLMASTFSSAMGSAMVAPRTLQALASDKSFPLRKINLFLAKGRGQNREPFNASFASFVIALVFVIAGDVNAVAQIISMFFLITYGSLCLISFLNHFGAPPSYRPRFRSKWFLSLGGFLLSIWVMFKINAMYTVLAYAVIVIIYLFMENSNKKQKGLVNIFKGTLFQLNRKIQVFMQKHQTHIDAEEWRPAAICISSHSFERDKVLDMMKWISHRHGFGTYFHFIEGYYNATTYSEARELLAKLIDRQKAQQSAFYIDTMISPSYTSALAQVIQAPSISGMENNMTLFEFDKQHPEELATIINSIPLVKAGNFDVCIFGGSASAVRYHNGIHVWITGDDETNVNLMIMLGYIIMAHPDWRKSFIKLFSICATGKSEETKHELEQRIAEGRLPITLTNIEIITLPEDKPLCEAVSEHSQYAGITILGFTDATLRHDPVAFFTAFDGVGDILFVSTDMVMVNY